MTDRQRAFCEFFAASGNATDAARRAGYSARSSYSQGERLLKNDEVRNYLHELQEQMASARIASAEEIQSYWSEVLRSGSERTADRLRAGQLLSRSAGQSLPQTVEEPETAEETPGDYAVVCLPCSVGDTPTAALMPDGDIVTLRGHEADDLLLYAPFDLPRWEDYELKDDPVEDHI